MMCRLLFILITFAGVSSYANDLKRPRVPNTMEFAGMHLKLTEAARRDIQKDVDALVRSPKYIEIKADRARLYFPIIEEVLKEEGVPSDFKYLALQESALISDAVSSANAVGFWQFKDFTGREVGLRIDRNVDERLNIVASTHGAAKYFKRHNFYFQNWIYTLLAHMTGRGGASKYVDKSNFGKNRMTLDGKTHWYVKRFLAHKIAYESEVVGSHSEGIKLVQYRKGKGKSLSTIAKEAKVDEDELQRYNKWMKTRKVPSEKEYVVIIPVKGKIPKFRREKPKNPFNDIKDNAVRPIVVKTYPKVDKNMNLAATIYIKINGLPCVLAKKNDDIVSMAKKSSLTPDKFVKYNDLMMSDRIIEGEIYYMKPKRNKAKIFFYTVQSTESLWAVSQKFGIKLVKLAKLNRMMTIDELKPRRVLWLNKKRPANIPVEDRIISKLSVDETIPVKKFKKKKEKKMVIKEVPVSKEKVVDKGKTSSVSEQLNNEPTVMENSVVIRNHLVTKGETLYSIANEMGVSVEDLVEWNDLYNGSIGIGQNLIAHGDRIISENLPKPGRVTFHRVKPDDTMYSISRLYKIPVNELLELNQKDNFNLTIGEKFIIKP